MHWVTEYWKKPILKETINSSSGRTVLSKAKMNDMPTQSGLRREREEPQDVEYSGPRWTNWRLFWLKSYSNASMSWCSDDQTKDLVYTKLDIWQHCGLVSER